MVLTKLSKLSTALVVVFFTLSTSATTHSVVIPVKAKGSGPLFRVQRHGKWGYMTRSGRIVIKPQFTDAEDFFNGLAAAELGEKWGYLKESGEFAIPPQFDGAMNFEGERASVKVNGRAGLIDRDGTFVASPRFEEIRPFSDGLAAVWLDAKKQANERIVWVYGGRWGFMDRFGKMVVGHSSIGCRIFQKDSPQLAWGASGTHRVMSQPWTAESGGSSIRRGTRSFVPSSMT
jgi:hypothetical protein